MAAAAGAGLDVPGLSPADLQLNACLCRALAARFPEVTDIPAGETRTVESVIHPRGDGAASAPPASSNSAGLSPSLDSRTSGVSSGDGTSVPASSSAIVPPGVPAQPSSSAPAPPSKSIDQLRRARLDTLTPAEKLRRYSNPKSSTAAGSRVKPHVPPPQPYACPLPGEEGHAEAAGQLDEAAREVGFLPSSSSLQELGPDGSHPAEFKEFADVDDSSWISMGSACSRSRWCPTRCLRLPRPRQLHHPGSQRLRILGCSICLVAWLLCRSRLSFPE
ncbi:hypothetical protein PF003_g8091 [Phytophthora fragariae]|nr:hypothetical protein PF003_g8091 [Phytophthora fragariae]